MRKAVHDHDHVNVHEYVNADVDVDVNVIGSFGPAAGKFLGGGLTNGERDIKKWSDLIQS